MLGLTDDQRYDARVRALQHALEVGRTGLPQSASQFQKAYADHLIDNAKKFEAYLVAQATEENRT